MSRTTNRTMTRWGAAAAAVALGVVSASTAASAVAREAPTSIVTARPLAVSRAADVSPAVSRVADIDGDGRPDTVALSLVTSRSTHQSFRLTVSTARRKVATTTFTVSCMCDGPASGTTPRRVLQGMAPIDGVVGSEVLVDLSSEPYDVWEMATYAWRAGKLQRLPAPGSGRSGLWGSAYPLMGIDGYTVSMVGKTRQVVRHRLRPLPGFDRFLGTDTTYTWSRSGWVARRTQRVGPVSADTAKALYFGFKGISFRR